MSKKLITTGLILTILGLGGFLTYKVSNDFKNGNLPIIKKEENKGNVNFKYLSYDLSNPIHKFYNEFLKAKEIEDKNETFVFDSNKNYSSKKIYKIYNDSYAMSYSFDKKNKDNLSNEKRIKKDVYKKNFSFLKNDDVDAIFINKVSTVIQADYLIEFKKPKTPYEIMNYVTKSFEGKSEEIDKELEILENYNKERKIFSDNKYKRLNISLSFQTGKMVIRNLVSERQEKNEIKKLYKRVYLSK